MGILSRIFHSIFKDMMKENKRILDQRNPKKVELIPEYKPLRFEPFKDIDWSYPSDPNPSEGYASKGWDQFY